MKFNFDNIDSAVNYSDLNFNDSKQSGGFSLFGSADDVAKIALEAISLKNIDVFTFLIPHIKKFGTTDDTGNTILHYAVSLPNISSDLVKTILSKDKSIINKQNNHGDTALMLAARTGNAKLCSMLVEFGADPKIKNNDGAYVDTETDSESGPKSEPIAQNKDKKNNIYKNIMGLFNKKPTYTNTSAPDTNFMNTATLNATALPDQIDDKIMAVANAKKAQVGGCPLCKQKGGCGCMSGGCIMCGQKEGCGCKITTDVEKTYQSKYIGGATKGSRSYNSNDDRELSRQIVNQASEIINRSVDKIANIITADKKLSKDFTDAKQAANAIKSLIWQQYRAKYGDTKNSLDIAIEMESAIDESLVKSFKKKEVSDLIKKIDERRKEKEQNKASKPKQSKPRSNKLVDEASSDAEVPSVDSSDSDTNQ